MSVQENNVSEGSFDGNYRRIDELIIQVPIVHAELGGLYPLKFVYFLPKCGHNYFSLKYNSSPEYIMMNISPQEVILWVCYGLHSYVIYEDE